MKRVIGMFLFLIVVSVGFVSAGIFNDWFGVNPGITGKAVITVPAYSGSVTGPYNTPSAVDLGDPTSGPWDANSCENSNLKGKYIIYDNDCDGNLIEDTCLEIGGSIGYSVWSPGICYIWTGHDYEGSEGCSGTGYKIWNSKTECELNGCTPDSCNDLGYSCGSWDDGCGGTLNCGGCLSGQNCSIGQCVDLTSQDTCTDSDGGSNYGIKGIVNSWISGVNNSIQDYCGENNTLKEQYCYGNVAGEESYNCPDKCLNGKCVTGASKFSCVDNDGGLNLTLKGTTEGNDSCGYRVETDSCYNSTAVIEYTCDQTQCAAVRGDIHECPKGSSCFDGACVDEGSFCGDGICNGDENYTLCVQDCPITCTSNCEGKQCGPDGCGGSCGSCPSGQNCSSGICVSPNLCSLFSAEWGQTSAVGGELVDVNIIGAYCEGKKMVVDVLEKDTFFDDYIGTFIFDYGQNDTWQALYDENLDAFSDPEFIFKVILVDNPDVTIDSSNELSVSEGSAVGPVCGDGICNGNETAVNCAVDCVSSGGGSGGNGTVVNSSSGGGSGGNGTVVNSSSGGASGGNVSGNSS